MAKKVESAPSVGSVEEFLGPLVEDCMNSIPKRHQKSTSSPATCADKEFRASRTSA